MLVENTDMIYAGSDPMARAWRGDEAIVWEPSNRQNYTSYFTMTVVSETLELSGQLNPAEAYEYSVNGGAWDRTSNWTLDSDNCPHHTFQQGDVIRWRGSSARRFHLYYDRGLTTANRVSVSGNIMSLVCGDNFSGVTSDTAGTICFENLFNYSFDHEAVRVVDASNLVLPLRYLPSNFQYLHGVYSNMFAGQEWMEHGPKMIELLEIPHMGCYNMFYGCSSLLDAPVIIATSLEERHTASGITGDADSHCKSMFKDCYNLITPPPVLKPKVAWMSSYEEMFRGCSSMTSIPEIRTRTINNMSMKNMFAGCESVSTAVIPVTEVNGNPYSANYRGAMEGLFDGFSALTSFTLYVTDEVFESNNSGEFARFLVPEYGVSTQGVFHVPAGVTWPSTYQYLPSGWTLEEDAPPLG